MAPSDGDAARGGPHGPQASSQFALAALIVLAVLSPWPFGCVQPAVAKALTTVVLGCAVLSLSLRAVEGGSAVPGVPAWPILAWLGLGAAQLLPLPPALLGFLAPGSHEVWHPLEPAAAVVLGGGARPVSVDPQATVRWLGLTAGLVVLVWTAAPAAELVTARRAAAALAASGAALAAYGIVARALHGPLVYGRFAVPTVSPFGPFVSKNHFAGYLEMTALLTLGLALGMMDRERRHGSRLEWTASPRASRILLALGAAVTMVLAILVSLSRGGLVSVTLGMAALWLLRQAVRQGRSARALGAVAVVVLVGAGLLAVLPREAQQRIASLPGVTSERSGSFRLDTWGDALRTARASPLVGQGMGAFADAFPRYKRGHGELRVEHAENDYLEGLVESGALGLGLVLAAGTLLLRRCLRALRESRDRLNRGISLGALAGLLALAVHGGFDFNLRIPSNAVLFATLGALALGAAGTRPAQGRAWVRRWVAPAAVVVLLFLSLSTPAVSPTSSQADLRRAAAASGPARELRLASLEADLWRSVRLRPADAEAWLNLSWTRRVRGAEAEGAALERHARHLDPSRFGSSGPPDGVR